MDKPLGLTTGRDPYDFNDDGENTPKKIELKTPQSSMKKVLRGTEVYSRGTDCTHEHSEEQRQLSSSLKDLSQTALPRRSSRRRNEVNYAEFFSLRSDRLSEDSNVDELRSEVTPSNALSILPLEVDVDKEYGNMDLPQPDKVAPLATTLPLSPPSIVPLITFAPSVASQIKTTKRKRGHEQGSVVRTKKSKTDMSSTQTKTQDLPSNLSKSNTERKAGNSILHIADTAEDEGNCGNSSTGVTLVKEKLSAASVQIENELKSLVLSMKSNNTRENLVDSLKVNFESHFAKYESALKVLKEEANKSLRSAEAMQNVCRNSSLSAEVAEEMLSVITGIHNEESRTVALRSKDPRFFSRTRQNIFTILKDITSTVGHSDEEKINTICNKILEKVKVYMDLNNGDNNLYIVEPLREELNKCLIAQRSAMNPIIEATSKVITSISNIQSAYDNYATAAESFTRASSIRALQTASLAYLHMYFALMEFKDNTTEVMENVTKIQNSREILPFADTLFGTFNREQRDLADETRNLDLFRHLRDMIKDSLEDFFNVPGERRN